MLWEKTTALFRTSKSAVTLPLSITQAENVAGNVRNMVLPMVLLLLQWHLEQLGSRARHSKVLYRDQSIIAAGAAYNT